MTDNHNGSDAMPERIGPYRILDLLGEGGMSMVYLAEQSEPVQRRVALKILKAGMDSKQVVARFESERQALAVLDHPNIAKIFDGGIADNGRPYFAMERVKGLPITDYCDQNRLSNEARLALFVKICSAVQHAHHKGLIHRDLKPSNILVSVVDGEPQPKIIDFGIAKATGTTLTESTLFTRVGQVLGTPQYMSPEQAGLGGLDIDTRTDVYSLGVVLYELLVGTVPLDLRAIGDAAMQVAITEREPPKPSTRFTSLGDTREEVARARRTDVDKLRQQLHGDLDWVVMRAIEKDRTRRYETANALGMDCQRFLNSEPVLARPPSAGYLLRRFVRRNRFGVIAASVALIGVLGGASAAMLGYVRAAEAEKVAVQEAEAATQIADFMTDLFWVTTPSEARGNEITAREILDRGVAQIEDSLDAQAATKIRLLDTMGNVYQNLGLYDEAEGLITKAHALASETFEKGDPRRTRAERSLGEVYYHIGRYDDAEALLLGVLEQDTANFGREHARVAYTLAELTFLYNKMDRLDEALPLAQESLSLRETLYGGDSEQYAIGLIALARIERERGDYEASLERGKRALSILDGLLPPDHPRVSDALNEITINLSEQERLEEQEPYTLRMLEIDEKVYGADTDKFATALENVGILYAKQRKLDLAETYFLRALEVSEKALGPVHDSVAFRNYNLGYLYGDKGDQASAEKHILRSIEIWTALFGEDHGSNGWGWNALAENYAKRGMFDKAEDAARRALRINEARFGDDHPNTSTSLLWLAVIAREEGRYADAQPLFERALAIREARFGYDGPRTHEVLRSFVQLLELTGQAERAAAVRERLGATAD